MHFLVAALLAQAVPPPVPVAATPAQDLFEKHCVFCHGADGKGQTRKGKELKAPNFTSARFQKHTTDLEMVEAVTDGIPKHKMPAFKDKLSSAEIASLANYVRSFRK